MKKSKSKGKQKQKYFLNKITKKNDIM